MKKPTRKYKIGVVGLWHLGEVYSAGLSDLGHDVLGFDENKYTVSGLNDFLPPLAEPGLPEIIKKNKKFNRLGFTDDFRKLKSREIIWLAFDTPVDDRDNVDLGPIWNFFKKNTKFFKNNVLITISSQVPVGTCADIKKFLTKVRPRLKFNLVYAPENLRLGTAIKSFFKPDRIIVGGENKKAIEKVKNIFSPLGANFISMSIVSAELSKHALNAFLATSLSFIYDIADIANACGADVVDVAKALRADKRIGKDAYLDTSLGFSGGTLARDLKILMKTGKKTNVGVSVISAVFKKNNSRIDSAVKHLKKYLRSLRGKKIAVLGLTYKPGTPTLQRAMSLEIINKLKKEGALIFTHDPFADQTEAEEITGSKFYKSPYLAAKGANAVLFVTDWPEFKKLNFKKIIARMKKPLLFFDTRNAFSDYEAKIKKAGFLYIGMGR